MSYTQRQQQLLKAMGFVPWVQREASSAPVVTGSPQAVAVSAERQAIDLAVIAANEVDIAHAAADVATIASRPLCSLANGFSIGHAQAPLLVVVETSDSNIKAPLEGDAAQLFEQMTVSYTHLTLPTKA